MTCLSTLYKLRAHALCFAWLCASLSPALLKAQPTSPLDQAPPPDLGVPVELGGQRALPLTEEELNRERWLHVVSAHSGTHLGLYEPIKVKLHREYVSPEALSTTPAPELISVQPATKGYTYWSAPNELSFKPAAGWDTKVTYRVSLSPHPTLEAPEGLAPLTFSFIAVEPTVSLSPVEMSLSQDGREALIKTSVSLSEQASRAQLTRLITARQDGQPVEVSWARGPDGSRWEAQAKVSRYDEPSELVLLVNGSALRSSVKGRHRLMIPKTGAFEVTRVYTLSEPSSRVMVELSEPLDPKQALEGMVSSPEATLKVEVSDGRLSLTPQGELKGPMTLHIAPGLRSISGRTLTSAQVRHITFEKVVPQVRKLKQGAILPSVERPLFAFETKGLRSVEVTALLVKERNLGQFLQRNRLSDSSEMTRVGRYLWRKRVQLKLTAPQLAQWQRHHLDLSGLLSEAPHGLINLKITFGRGDAAVTCDAKAAAVPLMKRKALKDQEERSYNAPSAWEGSWWNQSYSDRQDPCKDAYYLRDRGGHSITQNILRSNLGLISKKGAGPERFISVTDLLSAQPVPGAKVSLYNYQNDLLSEGVTDQDGFAHINEPRPVFYARVDHQGDFGVLKLDSLSRLATTHFDVGGVSREEGVNGALYAERGMWRPGDDIYLTFVLQDPKQLLPQGHPIFVTFQDPNGAEQARFMLRRGLNGFYPFTLKTEEGAMTGAWEVTVEVGAERFTKRLAIETFEPNRLQVNLRLPKTHFTVKDFPARLSVFSQWLHGAKARELSTTVKVSLQSAFTSFGSASEFHFNDVTRHFHQWPERIFSGKLDLDGFAQLHWRVPGDLPKGRLRARFTTTVQEPSGAESVEYRNATILSGERFVGVRLPKGDKRGMLLTDKPHQVLIKTLDGEGKPVDGAPLEIKLYKIEWKWWWDKSHENLVSIERRHHSRLLQTAQVSTQGGSAEWNLEVKSPIWGRFLLKVCEQPDGHCSAQVLYLDWPGWANETGEKSIGQTYLPMSLDDTRYQVGQTAKLRLPIMPQGRALVSLESGAHLISQRWVELGEQETEVSIPITSGMAPNIYVNVTAIQPHARSNDKPIRLYTVLPIKVEDPMTHLKPRLELPKEVRPESEITVKVSEEEGRPMTYTLALVDEGLLGVTAFKTPDLHKAFFKRLALKVKSWDLFDDVIGAYGGVVERLLTIGGAEGLDEEEDKRRRFEPVVLYQGPFELKPGEQASHSFQLPQYVGAVRAMLVGGHQSPEQSAYGSTSEKVIVRQALMVLPNLPKVIGPEEVLTLPVSVFATSPELKEVELFTSTSDPESFVSPRVALSFNQPSEQEQLARLRLKVGPKVGVQTLRFTAESGSWVARQKVNLPVRIANPPSSVSTPIKLGAGEMTTVALQPFGIPGTRSGTLEVSWVPQLHISDHLSYLIRYPHGCAEQTTSKAFPQLYLSALTRLSGTQRAASQSHVEAAIRKLKGMQSPQGAFTYWPGGEVNDWTNSYVGHFLLSAKERGYQVPAGTLSSWVARQGALAQQWSHSSSATAQEEQAYRLLTLALARAPELGAMNRLRQGGELSLIARWLLARAYALSGQIEATRALMQDKTEGPRAEGSLMRGFKSSTRDLALQLEAYVALGDQEEAEHLSLLLIERLNEQGGGHTHELASALKALGVWAGSRELRGTTYGVDYAFGEPGHRLDAESSRYLYGSQLILQHPLRAKELAAQQLSLKNDSAETVYITLNRRGTPRAGEEVAQSSELNLKVSFIDEQGRALTPTQVQQGQALTALLQVKNTSEHDLGQLALTYGVPSGWRVENDRLTGRVQSASALKHQDIQDDHVKLYFELKAGQEWSHELRLNAAFEGLFYHPATYIEAMYRPSAFALEKGFWTQVRR